MKVCVLVFNSHPPQLLGCCWPQLGQMGPSFSVKPLQKHSLDTSRHAFPGSESSQVDIKMKLPYMLSDIMVSTLNSVNQPSQILHAVTPCHSQNNQRGNLICCQLCGFVLCYLCSVSRSAPNLLVTLQPAQGHLTDNKEALRSLFPKVQIQG